MNFDEKELFALVVVGLVALSIPLLGLSSSHFFSESSYANALLVEHVIKGESAPGAGLFHQFAAFTYFRIAAFTGATGVDVGLLTTILSLLPAFIILAIALGAYFSLRGFFAMGLPVSALPSAWLMLSTKTVSMSARTFSVISL